VDEALVLDISIVQLDEAMYKGCDQQSRIERKE
jgi:hypothetical protein